MRQINVFEGLDADRIVEMFGRYLDLSGPAISRAQAQGRMFAKLANPRFLLDTRPFRTPGPLRSLVLRWTSFAERQVPAWKKRCSVMKPTAACVNIRSWTNDAIRAIRPA